MKNCNCIRNATLVALASLHLMGNAQVVTQAIVLQPGWNSVFLEVQPADNSADAVFGGLPVTSAWSRAERLTAAEYIQNATEATFNEAGWLRWFHPSRPEAFLNNLRAIHANHAYLIKSTNVTPVVWSVSGRPSLRQLEWVPDAYNLRGLPVDPAAPPTFLNFFRHAKAHFNAANGQLEKIFRLNGSGQWAQVSSNDVAQSGAAYWVYSRGASDYVAPLSAQLELGNGLEFGAELTELPLRLKNVTMGPMNVMVRDLGLSGPAALSYFNFNPTLGGQWPPLPSPLISSPAAVAELRLRLAIRRQDLASSSYASVLEIKNGTGTRFLVPVSAEKGAGTPGANPRAGLWIGTATINAVSEANSANPTNPTPTKSELNLRLLIHVAANGQARLLKEVIQMWRDGTLVPGPNGLIANKPGQYVLLTDDRLIQMFKGATMRDGQSVGRRLSTVGYDFPTSSSNNLLHLSGGFAPGQKLTGTLTMPFDHPTNPFKHKYHPDHDNLNARFDGPATESFTTTRQMELDFMSSPPSGPAVPDFGYNEMGGLYREIITGIHKRTIRVSGTFRLARVSLIAELNPSPTP